jgi:hypothetical protein
MIGKFDPEFMFFKKSLGFISMNTWALKTDAGAEEIIFIYTVQLSRESWCLVHPECQGTLWDLCIVHIQLTLRGI